ncbi:hypothetical protein XENORESO_002570 [Xenotaenia resolanae]|uniref:Uncharacterized protein n=1 Tax=Xenotaenia resolanae TaxID=208358 RepID=A0ABV0X887_9TELE
MLLWRHFATCQIKAETYLDTVCRQLLHQPSSLLSSLFMVFVFLFFWSLINREHSPSRQLLSSGPHISKAFFICLCLKIPVYILVQIIKPEKKKLIFRCVFHTNPLHFLSVSI